MLTSVVRVSPKAGRVTLQRYLLTKFVLEMEKVTLTDLCTLFDNQLWIEQKVQTDQNFHNKFGKSFEDLSKILKEINFRQEFTERALRRFRQRILEELSKLLLPKRNFSSVGNRYRSLYQLSAPYQPGVDRKNLPPVRRIGKGYTDKGTLRNKARDGSPSWQEVAAHRGPLYKEGIPYETSPVVEATGTMAAELIELIRKCQ